MRRTLASPFWMVALSVIVLSLAACTTGAPVTPVPGQATAPAAEEAAAPTSDSRYKEAPQLAEMVAAGELSPVEERLPNEPLVVEPVEEIGVYGGTWRSGLLGGSDNAWLIRTMGYDQLAVWSRDWSTLEPGVAKSIDFNEAGNEFTFHLREGLKWSDGEPFTADDIMFWYEDVLLNPELTPVVPAWLRSGDEPMTITKTDDYTFVVTFPEPNGLFLARLAGPSGAALTQFPRHYLEQFHSSYNDDIDFQAEGFNDWSTYWASKSNRWGNVDLPTIYAWRLTTGYTAEAIQVVAERNPYYWKVDPEGQQLPYIDRLEYGVASDIETLVLRAANGEIDMQDRHIATIANKPVLFDNQEAGNYHLFETENSAANVLGIHFNLNHTDPVKHEIFNNIDFRIGLSHAINRQELIDLIYVGQTTPMQPAPAASSKYYHERLATQYLEYDVDLANEYLDTAGYTEYDSEGFRLGPDGNRLRFDVIMATTWQDLIDIMEMVKTYWAEVGVEINLDVMERSLWDERRQVPAYDIYAYNSAGGSGVTPLLEPRDYFPFYWASNYAPLWARWYENPDDPTAVEPPDDVKRQMELYDEIKRTPDDATQVALFQQILDIAADRFYLIGISNHPPGYGVVSNNMGNIPELMPSSWEYPNPGPTRPEQYFFRSEE